jgi:hypothetical protein
MVYLLLGSVLLESEQYLVIYLFNFLQLFSASKELILRYQQLCCVYFSLPNIINMMYT